jgi:hypothetical protein
MTEGNGRSNNTYTNLSKKQLANWARKMRIQPNSIIAFNSGAITKEGLDALADIIKGMKIPNVVLLVVDNINNMRELSEEDMNKLGWFKVESLQKLIMRERLGQEAEKNATPEESANDDIQT